MGIRRRAREVAFQALFEIDTTGHLPGLILERLLEQKGWEGESSGAKFAQELLLGALEKKQEIDGMIAAHAPAWPLNQMAPVDRNLLRIAIFELLFYNGTPVKVVINEAVELAKLFGSESSPRFVNGVLGAIVKEGPKERR